MDPHINFMAKVKLYQTILEKTELYRQAWTENLKPLLRNTLETINRESGLEGEIIEIDELANIGLVQFSLGTEASGIAA
nr:hypothetical protein [Saprospiraceae bacterium]